MKMEFPVVDYEVLERAPYTPIAGSNDGIVRDKNGYLVADTKGHEGMAEGIALLLNLAALHHRLSKP